jgi:glutamate 5-kinase
LLPVGITGVEGSFSAGDAVSVCDQEGRELARGIVDYSSEELEAVKGLRSQEAAEVLPHTSPDAIHRDYLVLVE